MSASDAIPVANFYKKCFTCLSVGRHLQPLQEIVLLDTLCPQIKINPLESGTLHYVICWECNATLKKIKEFQAQVITAHDKLLRFIKNAPSLSRLSTTTGPIVTILPPANTPFGNQITNTEPAPTKKPTPNTISTPKCASTSRPIVVAETSPRVFFPTIIGTSKLVQPNASNTIETTTSLEITIDPLITDIKKENEDVDEDTMDFDNVIEPTTIKFGNDIDTDTAREIKMDPSDQSETKSKKEKEEKNYFVPIKLKKIQKSEPSVSNELLVERTSKILPKMKLKHKISKTPNAPLKLRGLHQAVKVTVYSDKASTRTKKPMIIIDKGNIQKPQDRRLNNIPTKLNNPSNLQGSDCILALNEPSGKQVPCGLKPATKIDDKEMECENQLGFKDDQICCRKITQEEMVKFREAKLNDKVYKKSEFRCTTCLVWFRSKALFEGHNKMHDEKAGDHVCNICEQRFTTVRSLTAHYNKHYMVFECMVCKWQSQDRLRITLHYQKRHEIDSFECKKCMIWFDTYKERRTHYREVHPKKLTCTVCSKQLSCKLSLQLHMATHDDEKTQCEVCKKYIRTLLLPRHITTAHNEPPDPHYCGECNITFRYKRAYEFHMKTTLKHNSLEDVGCKCDHCGKMFAWKTSLITHIQAEHEAHPAIVCKVCNKECKSKRNFMRHMKSHQKKKIVKRIICDICGSAFAYKSCLRDHMNKHTGLRPYKCQDCGNTFSFSAALFTHRRLVHKVKRKKDLLNS